MRQTFPHGFYLGICLGFMLGWAIIDLVYRGYCQ